MQLQYEPSAIPRLRHLLAGLRVQAAALRYRLALKAGYDPKQPRVPAGQPEGGQWTDDLDAIASSSASQLPSWSQAIDSASSKPTITLAQARGGGSRGRAGGRFGGATPAQQTVYDIQAARTAVAVQRLRRIERDWREPRSWTESPSGQIEHLRAVQQAAEARYAMYQGKGLAPGPYAVEWIEAPVGRRANAEEIRENNRIGYTYGCHTCGTREPGTSSGNFVFEHQPATRLLSPGESQIILPHCLSCSLRQGGNVRQHYRLIVR